MINIVPKSLLISMLPLFVVACLIQCLGVLIFQWLLTQWKAHPRDYLKSVQFYLLVDLEGIYIYRNNPKQSHYGNKMVRPKFQAFTWMLRVTGNRKTV